MYLLLANATLYCAQKTPDIIPTHSPYATTAAALKTFKKPDLSPLTPQSTPIKNTQIPSHHSNTPLRDMDPTEDILDEDNDFFGFTLRD